MSTTKIYKPSLFKNKGELTTSVHVDYNQVYQIVSTGTFNSDKDLQFYSKRVLNETDKVKQSELKNTLLPFLSVSVQYSPAATSKSADQPYHHTGEVQLDYDHLTPAELERLTTALKADDFTNLLFKSPRGSGLKQFVTVDGITIDNHDAVYYALRQYVKQKHNAVADESCAPVTKGCFLCYDPSAYLNLDAAAMSADELIKTYPAPKKPTIKASKSTLTTNELERNREVVEDLIQQAISGSIIVTSSYSDWISLGFSLKHTFGEAGFKYWDSFSKIDTTKYKGEESTRYKWDNDLVGTSRKPITFASTVHFAKEAGLVPIKSATPPAKRNPTTTFDDIMNEWLKDYSIWFDTGSRTYYYGTSDSTSVFDLRKVAKGDAVVNKWMVELERKGLMFQKSKLEDGLFNEMYRHEFDYMIDQLEYLASEYDGVDHLSTIIGTVKTHDDELFNTYFTKWAVNLVAGIYQASIYDVNEHAIVFTGGQGLKKSGFFTGLMWNQDYCANVHSFNPENKQHELLMTTSPLILIDEMTGYSKSDIGSLKSVFSKAKVTTDKKFENNDVFKRISSFCGTTNEHDFLKDATGDRRFLTFEVIEELNYTQYNSIDKKQLWGQIVTMYKNGYNYKLSQAEIKDTIERNQEFSLHTHEDTMIETMFEITGNKTDCVTAAQMRALESEYKTIYKPQFLNSNTVKNKLQMRGVKYDRTRIDGTQTRAYIGVRVKFDTPISNQGININTSAKRNGLF